MGGCPGGLAVGLTYAIAILGGGPLSGGSLNPARTFGPALFTGDWKSPMMYLVYFLGPLLGSLIAVAVYQFLSYEKSTEEEVEVEVEEDEEVAVEETKA